MFLEGVHSIEGCFLSLKFQIIFSVKEFAEGFGNSNDMANN